MKCTIDNKYLAALRDVVSQRKVSSSTELANASADVLHIVAVGNTIKITSGLGEAELPSRIERPGALIVPAAAFLRPTEEVRTKFWLDVEASDDCIKVNGARLSLKPGSFIYSADPATDLSKLQVRRD